MHVLHKENASFENSKVSVNCCPSWCISYTCGVWVVVMYQVQYVLSAYISYT